MIEEHQVRREGGSGNVAALPTDALRSFNSIYRDTRLVVTSTDTGAPLARHTPIALPGGLYEVCIQRELEITPGRITERRVRD